MTDLRKKFEEAVEARVCGSFDLPSRTHIFYFLGPGPDIKGFGDWPNQAFDDFITKLKAVIDKTSDEMLTKWLEELNG